MQYNTALCFLALGAAGIGLSASRRLVVLAGGSFAALMGAAVMLEYGTGVSFGIDTLFFYPWVTSTEFPDEWRRPRPSVFSSAAARWSCSPRVRRRLGSFWILNAIPLSLALTALIGYVYGITYVLPFGLGLQMALHTAAAFAAYGVAMLRYAWTHAERGADGLPQVGGRHQRGFPAGAAGRRQRVVSTGSRGGWCRSRSSCRSRGVALATLAMRKAHRREGGQQGPPHDGDPVDPAPDVRRAGCPREGQGESAQEWALHSAEVIGVSQALLARVAETESAARGYVITGDAAFVAVVPGGPGAGCRDVHPTAGAGRRQSLTGGQGQTDRAARDAANGPSVRRSFGWSRAAINRAPRTESRRGRGPT